MSTGIEWTDETWNPVTGCDTVSPGCDHCYARTLAKRLKAMGAQRYQTDGDLVTSGPGFGLTMHAELLRQPLSWRKPRMVFVNSMSDLFHKDVTDEFIAQVWATMALAHRHTFQVLTKRHGRMRALLNSPAFNEEFRAIVRRTDASVCPNPGVPVQNVWLGVSAENQQWADTRIPALLDTPAVVRFISAEPLLGPIDLAKSLAGWTPRSSHFGGRDALPASELLHWVIVGGESGQGARPMHPDWARQLRDQCAEAGVAFFFKQWGEWAPTHDGRHRVTFDGRLLQPHGGCVMSSEELVARVGKKAAGSLLDGREHKAWPEVTR